MDERLTIYRIIPGQRDPVPADRSAGGQLPTRAFRYCEPVTAASGLGWYLFLPDTLAFRWDGDREIRWFFRDKSMGLLTQAQYPGFAEHFDEWAPEGIKGYAPPFLSVSPHEPGTIQIWTGYMIRTTPGWSTLVRPPVNMPRAAGYELYEGLIETDQWFGPLFLALRLSRTHRHIIVSDALPFVQIQLVPRSAYPPHLMRVVSSLEEWRDDDWVRYSNTVVKPNSNPQRGRGEYAVGVRQRRSREKQAEENEARL